MKQGGFTFIELMIVVTIIGILTAFAVPQYQTYTIRSQVSSQSVPAKANLQAAIAQYINEYSALPNAGFTDLAKIGFVKDDGTPYDPTSLNTEYIESVNWTGSEIVLLFKNTHSISELAGKTLAYEMTVNGNGSTTISVSTSTIPVKYLPKR